MQYTMKVVCLYGTEHSIVNSISHALQGKMHEFCRSQLLNFAHTLRVTGVKLIMECLWSAEKNVLFQLVFYLIWWNFLETPLKDILVDNIF